MCASTLMRSVFVGIAPIDLTFSHWGMEEKVTLLVSAAEHVIVISLFRRWNSRRKSFFSSTYIRAPGGASQTHSPVTKLAYMTSFDFGSMI